MLVSSSTCRSSEEAILLLVKVIRHSVKSVKNLMIKKRETGGMVVFNLWWDYTLCRIINISHDKSVVRENLENYTAVMLFRELCGLITEDMSKVVKSGLQNAVKRYSVYD